MRRAIWIQRLIRLAVLMAMLAVGLGFGLGLRHRHAGGEFAHSHGHAHPHSHSHPHSHKHPHRHPHEEPEPSSHIHVTFFGIEITLPDFMGGEPAPLVETETSDGAHSVTGEVVTVSGPIGPGAIVRFVTGWTAIRPELIRVTHEIPLIEFIGLSLPLSFGVDAPSPRLPPPEAS